MFLLILLPAGINSFSGKPTVGGGGAGPAGGGGGGNSGAGLPSGERLQFIALESPAPDAAAIVAPPPKPAEQPKPAPEQQPAPVPTTTAPVPSGIGTGTEAAGAGNAGTSGAGPGTGGGIGSGTGTGIGSANGPGTGGGPGTNYPPTPTQFFLPPLPAPHALRGYHLIAYFDVDEKGTAKLLGFNPSRDGGYNRKLRDVLLALRFRPGVRPNGTPVRDTVDIQFIF